MNRPHPFVVIFALLTLSTLRAGDGGGSDYNLLSRPLSKIDALNLALLNNSTILKAQKDVEAAFGVAIQVRAIVFPKINHSANYRVRQDSLIEANRNRELPSKTVKLAGLGPIRLGEGAMPRTLEIMPRTLELGGGTTPRVNNQDWAAEVRVVQSLYEGGRMLSALRSSKLIRGQALLTFESTVADTLLSVSNAYDTVLSTEKQIEVRTAAVTFLSAYLKDTKIRNAVGDLPEFDVVRQEVEVANAVAQKVQAVGDHRVAKQNLVQLLGYDLPI
ncbi:MAG: TolC family protein, partial [Verrucomicrobiota bacterium]